MVASVCCSCDICHVSIMAVMQGCGLVGVLVLFWCGFFFFFYVAASLLLYLCLVFHTGYIWGFGKPEEGFFNTQIFTVTVSVELKL